MRVTGQLPPAARTRSDYTDGILVEALTRTFQRRGSMRHALNELSFTVGAGEVCGLLGPNGSGKTTLARVLTTLLVPSSGRAVVAGYDVERRTRDVQMHIGVSFGGENGLYTRLSARDNLRFFGTMYGLRRRRLQARTEELLSRVGLSDRANDRVEIFSRGMRQRLHIARALIHDPQVVVLDEPSGGLDASAAQDLRELVRGLREEGRTVLLTTHNLDEVEAVCDRVVIIRNGSAVADAAPAVLRGRLGQRSGTRIHVSLAEEVTVDWHRIPGVYQVESSGLDVTLVTVEPRASIDLLLGRLAGRVRSISMQEPTLEEAYLAALAEA